jgi:hypothetical protein
MSSPEEIRLEIFRQGRRIYDLAAEVRLHPGRLGMMIGGKIPMPPEIATRLREALLAEEKLTVG